MRGLQIATHSYTSRRRRDARSVSWTVRYEADALPTASTPVWVGEDAGVSVAGGILHYTRTQGQGGGSYNLADGNINGLFTVEWKTKIVTAPDIYNHVISMYSGAYYFEVDVEEDRVLIDGDYISEVTQEYLMDTTDDYHTYRLTANGTAVNLYIDGVLKLTGTLNLVDTTSGTIYFGSWVVGASGTDWYLDYLYYRTDGAFAP